MEYEWDEGKALANEAKHGTSFDDVLHFGWTDALIFPDLRYPYGESRFKALGKIGGRLYVLIFTPRAGRCRVISLRKANEKEEAVYDDES